MSRVVKAIKYGSFNHDKVQNTIYYILFELAESDLRKHIDLDNKLNFAAQLRVLQQAAPPYLVRMGSREAFPRQSAKHS